MARSAIQKGCLHHAHPVETRAKMGQDRTKQFAKLTPEFDTMLMKILICSIYDILNDSTNQIVSKEHVPFV
jgi:hypothetical protein